MVLAGVLVDGRVNHRLGLAMGPSYILIMVPSYSGMNIPFYCSPGIHTPRDLKKDKHIIALEFRNQNSYAGIFPGDSWTSAFAPQKTIENQKR